MRRSYFFGILGLGFMLAFSIFFKKTGTLSPEGVGLAKVLQDARTQFAEVKGDSILETEFFDEFERSNPILIDWLHQDTDSEWKEAVSEVDAADDEHRITKVIEDLEKLWHPVDDLRKSLDDIIAGKSKELGEELYVRACEMRRGVRLRNFLDLNTPIVFAQHHNFLMSFIGYTEGLSDARHERFFKPGARLMQLSFDGLYGDPEVLIDDPYGMIRDVDVRDDAREVIFSWKKSDRLDDYHIYSYDIANREIRQLTTGMGRADYEPVSLPDGDIIFTSTRPEQSVPCWWTEISNLYRMNDEGEYIRRLAIDQVHTLYPQVLENGRVLYTRWDYSDRGQNYPHPLFNMNPDGTDQRVYYGGNSWFPTSLLHARTIPGTDKVMAIAAGHHTRQHGKVVVLDVTQGRDEGKGMDFVAPKRYVDYERVDVAQQHGDQFRYPYPLNENEFLVSYISEKKDAQVTKYADNAVYGLYWMDHDGNRELLYNDGLISVGRPVPLNKPTSPALIPDTVDYTKETGTYYVHDVYEGVGLRGIPRGTAKKIRVVRLNYRAAGVGQSRNEGEGGRSLNSSPVALGNGSWDIKEILGDVDIEADGSALFEVPAMESIYLQVLDKKGRVIQNTRSWDTVRPGEKKACRGCHAKEDANVYDFKRENTLAWKSTPQKLQPFYEGVRGFSFIKEIQPILDTKCVGCHDGSQEGMMSLKGTMKNHGTLEKRTWSESYLNLTHAEKKQRRDDQFYLGDPENEVVNWISKMSKPTELDPYSFGAATSGMMKMLEEGHHEVELTEKEYHLFAAWLDLLVPFVGEYREANDWTAKEMAYYDYYEHKRGEHKKEEIQAIEKWMKEKDNDRQNTYRAVKNKGYRTLASVKSENGICKFSWEQDVLFDRLQFSINMDSPIQLWADGVAVEQDRLQGGNGEAKAVLCSQLIKARTIKISATVDKPFEVSVFGRTLQELPSFKSHHPYLALCDEE